MFLEQFMHAVEEEFGTAEDRQARLAHFSLRQRDMATLEVVQAQHEPDVFASAASMDIVREPFDGMFHQKNMHQVFIGVPLKKDTAEQSEQIVFKVWPVPVDDAVVVFDKNPLTDVVWDDEPQHGLDSHTGLLEQIAQGGRHFIDGQELIARLDFNDEQNSVNGMPLPLDFGFDSVNVLFSEMPHEMVVWDEEVPSNLNARETLLQQLAMGEQNDDKTETSLQINVDEVLMYVGGLPLFLEHEMGAADKLCEEILDDFSNAEVLILDEDTNTLFSHVIGSSLILKYGVAYEEQVLDDVHNKSKEEFDPDAVRSFCGVEQILKTTGCVISEFVDQDMSLKV